VLRNSGILILNGNASSVTEASPLDSLAKMARGLDRYAANVVLKGSEVLSISPLGYVTIWLNIQRFISLSSRFSARRVTIDVDKITPTECVRLADPVAGKGSGPRAPKTILSCQDR